MEENGGELSAVFTLISTENGTDTISSPSLINMSGD